MHNVWTCLWTYRIIYWNVLDLDDNNLNLAKYILEDVIAPVKLQRRV